MKEKKPNLVYETLKQDILLMKIKPGEAIGEVDIANKFNVSRTPVRDAIRRLEFDQLVEVKSHIGTYVTLIDLDKISDAIYMREKIEKSVIIDLIQNIRHNSSLKLIYALDKQKTLLESDKSYEQKASEFLILDNEFHRILFELTGRSSIWDYLQNIMYHYDRLRVFLNIKNEDRITRLYQEHVELFQYIKDRDIEKAHEVYENHLYYGVSSGTKEIFENKKYFSLFIEENDLI